MDREERKRYIKFLENAAYVPDESNPVLSNLKDYKSNAESIRNSLGDPDKTRIDYGYKDPSLVSIMKKLVNAPEDNENVSLVENRDNDINYFDSEILNRYLNEDDEEDESKDKIKGNIESSDDKDLDEELPDDTEGEEDEEEEEDDELMKTIKDETEDEEDEEEDESVKKEGCSSCAEKIRQLAESYSISPWYLLEDEDTDIEEEGDVEETKEKDKASGDEDEELPSDEDEELPDDEESDDEDKEKKPKLDDEEIESALKDVATKDEGADIKESLLLADLMSERLFEEDESKANEDEDNDVDEDEDEELSDEDNSELEVGEEEDEDEEDEEDEDEE